MFLLIYSFQQALSFKRLENYLVYLGIYKNYVNVCFWLFILMLLPLSA